MSTPENPDSKSDLGANKKFPLVVFLHGPGERGNNNTAQLKYGLPQFSSDEMMQKYPAFAIAPQCPRGSRWVEVDWSADSHVIPEQPSKPMTALMELINHKMETLPTDPSRIYVTGLSMGGYGTWDLITRRPNLFAAALPICGGGDSSADPIDRIKHIPLRVVQGNRDRAVPVKRSRDMIAALKKAGADPIYIELPGVGHNSWTATYTNPATFSWLFKHRQK